MKYKYAIIITIITCALCIIYGTKFYNYYSPAKERSIYHTTQHNDNRIRIAYIGDSWAFGHHYHECEIANLLSSKLLKPVIVSSYGIGGLTSKEIYHALFEIDNLKQFMEEGYDFCYISAGINDTNKKMSTKYYTESMDCIIKFMLENNIHPIIQEIPDYNITKAYEHQKTKMKLIRRLSMLINNTSIDCKQDFRNALDKLIEDRKYLGKVSIIRYKSWNNNYEKGLKELYLNDQMHLNEKGYSVLDSVISEEISKIAFQ